MIQSKPRRWRWALLFACLALCSWGIASSEESVQALWQYTTNGSIRCATAVAPDGTVYVGSDDGSIYALHPDGTLLWFFETGGSIGSVFVGEYGRIYLGSWDNTLYALYPNGVLLWSYETGGHIRSTPVASEDGILCFGSDDGSLYALDAEGNLSWRFATDGYVRSSPVIAPDGTILVGSEDGYVYAVSREGSLLWRFAAGSPVSASVALGSGPTFYVAPDDVYLYALDATGAPQWSFEADHLISTAPVVAKDGTVYFGSWDRCVYAVSPDGTLVWKLETGGRVQGTPVLDELGRIYFGSDDGSLYAIESDGSVLLRYQTGGPVRSSPAIGEHGNVYAGSDDGTLYAVPVGPDREDGVANGETPFDVQASGESEEPAGSEQGAASEEETESTCTTYYQDEDGDGYGDALASACLHEAEDDYSTTQAGDCDDENPEIHPGAIEICDGTDNDCDGQTDEGEGLAGCTTYYRDVDGDGHGDASVPGKCLCSAGADPWTYYTATQWNDCDDADPAIHPGAVEVCDGTDNDCDGEIDDDPVDCITYYRDMDRDGYGQSNRTNCLCASEGFYRATTGGDCNDSNDDIHPGACEICDGKDNDCDGQTDEGEGLAGCTTYYRDTDGDTYGDASLPGKCLCSAGASPWTDYTATVQNDCDDSDDDIHPGACEVCDGEDNDCDGQTDEGEGLAGCTTYYRDADHDTYGDLSLPGKCLCSAGASPWIEYTSTVWSDCDDTDASTYPGATEVCDGEDNDCDGQSDEGEGLAGCTTYYRDADGDTYGDLSLPGKCLCSAGAAPWYAYTATVQGDCNDMNPLISPAATEVCDGEDNDCDGQTDEGEGCSGCTTYYLDADNDTYGDMYDGGKCLCFAGASPWTQYTATTATDCDDHDASVHPGGVETNCSDGKDNDCDGATDCEDTDCSCP